MQIPNAALPRCRSAALDTVKFYNSTKYFPTS